MSGKFDSPIGSKKVIGQPLREFDVSDETGYSSDQEMLSRHRNQSFNQQVDLNQAMAYQQKMQNEPEEDSMEIERQIRAAREAKRSGKERLNDGAKRRIEMLIGMTRSIREVIIENNKFVFQTLNSKEMREAILLASAFDHTVQSPFEVRRQFLARSLTHIAGIEVAQFVGSNNLEDRLELIDNLDESLLNRLFEEYSLLVQESREKFSIKSVEDIKEVAGDLKK